MTTLALLIAVFCAGFLIGNWTARHPAETAAKLAAVRDWIKAAAAKLKGGT